jgi:hypothetical protein
MSPILPATNSALFLTACVENGAASSRSGCYPIFELGCGEMALLFLATAADLSLSSRYEANVVMLLFAGTHNLENVLGHAIRLLLQHPEQLAELKKVSSVCVCVFFVVVWVCFVLCVCCI